MDFHYINPARSDSQTRRDPCPEFEDVDENDFFYAELRRQVFLLTADDGDDFSETNCSKFLSTPACRPGSNSFPVKLRPESYFDWWEMQNIDLVPTWLVNLWRKGSGTGVFIPQNVNTRRRFQHGTMNNGRRQIYRQVGKK